MYEDAEPISSRGVPNGVPMLTSSGREFGRLDRVLEIPAEDLFHGMVVRTKAGPRFVDRDQIADITTRFVQCDLDEFRRPRWKRER